MVSFLNWFVLVYFIVLTAGYIAMFAAAIVGVIRVRRELEGSSPESVSLRGRATLPISIIVPAYNEEKTVVASVRALLNLRYPQHEVVVVNDGSSDETLARLRTAFALESVPIDLRRDLQHRPIRAAYRSAVNRRLVVIDKENGGKADALNCAVNTARFPLVCAIDADTLIIPDALLRLVRPFLSDLDVVGVGGTLCLANGCKIERGNVVEVGLPRKWLARFQVVEYMRAFLVGRLGWDALGGNLIVSGAFGLFRRAAIVKAGGYATDTVGEDMELVARLRHDVPKWLQARAIRHLPDPVSFTEAPESVKILGNQRDRWQRGLVDTLWRHKRMTLNPRYGAIGLFVMPFFWLFELIGPLIEFFGYIYLLLTLLGGMLEPFFASLFGIMALLSGFLLSLGGILLEELSLSFFRARGDMGRLIFIALMENFGYRQMVLFYRIRGMINHLLGSRQWGRMVRSGFREEARTYEGARLFIPVIVTVLIAVMAAMPLAWLLKERPQTSVVVMDKTVPFQNYREHKRLMWLLSYHKVQPPEGRLLWSVQRDYVGYDPRAGQAVDINDEHLRNHKLLYIADAYGVYTGDYISPRNQVEHLELSDRIYGGINNDEAAAIERFVRGGGRLVGEFNCLGSPTSAGARKRLERMLGVSWTGWAARHLHDFSDYREIADWVRRRWELEFKRKWDLEGPGLLFVHEDGRVVAMREGIELADPPIYLRSGDRKIPYEFWFDIVQAVNQHEVRAEFRIDFEESGARLLQAFGIPDRFPAVVHDDELTRVYMAGDFSDSGHSLGPAWMAGVTTLREWMARMHLMPDDTRLTWEVYAPLVDRIIKASAGEPFK